MSSTTVTRGNVRESFLIGPTITPTSVSAYSSAVQTFNVPGLLSTDFVETIGAVGTQTAGIIPGESDCYNNGVLSIQFANATNASATPTAGVYAIRVTRVEGSLPANAA